MQHIVETAAELFGEHGYDAVSVDDVADQLDVTKGSLYYYFDSKDDLATAAIETLGNEWTTRLQELSRTITSSTADRLQALLHEHGTTAVQDYPAALQLFLVPRSWPTPAAPKTIETGTVPLSRTTGGQELPPAALSTRVLHRSEHRPPRNGATSPPTLPDQAHPDQSRTPTPSRSMWWFSTQKNHQHNAHTGT